MERRTHDISEVMPVETNLFDGQFETDGDIEIRNSNAERVGDLYRSDFGLSLEHGEAEYSILGGSAYFVNWSTYRFRRGLSYAARFDSPFVELHFQLEGGGAVRLDNLNTTISVAPGDSNLLYLPGMDGSFSLDQDHAGKVFEVVLSVDYVMDLAGRFPEVLDGFLEKMRGGDPFWLSKEHFHITPRMLDIIHRIDCSETIRVAGSLFLEAQILDLLAQQFMMVDRSPDRNGSSLTRSDADRMHEARSILLCRLDNPPTLAELARQVGTNEFKLKRGFRALFGTTPYACLLEYKLELARSYLLDTRMTIAEIAFKVGYSDPAHLTNAFRKQYGQRPSDLR